jgi:S-DNA-T family DNA segregation ATPase FtsK/SpoIIIE
VISETRKASATLLQRKLWVGFARAARIMDQMEERGLIGPQDGAKPRDIFM